MDKLIRLAVILPALFLTACAHPVIITPLTSELDANEVKKIDKNVGYFIAEADRQKRVESPGGGGDRISYMPYKDIEPALQKVLDNVFADVFPVTSLEDKAFLQTNKISYIFAPKFETDSSSSSAFTWPPTSFTISLDCVALDSTGRQVWKTSTKQVGEASFVEFKTDFPLAAKRAVIKTMKHMQNDINSSKSFY